MIACPLCGCPTEVVEARSSGTARVRRRRRCANVACDGKITTIELPLGDHAAKHEQLVVMSRRIAAAALRALREALGEEP